MDENLEVVSFDNEPKKFSVLDTYGENLRNKVYITNPAIPEFYSYLIKKMYFIALKRLFFCLHL